jgi:transcriptional regulator with XRE-family HTH domain
MSNYRYTESGLDNVIIEGVSFCADDSGADTITIPNVNGLHKAIATALVQKPGGMTGPELRFLRTEMEMTQAELAKVVNREPLAISRWERGEVEQIDANAEALIRMLAKEVLELPIQATVRDITGWSVPSAQTPALRIDGSNPAHYKLLPTAA